MATRPFEDFDTSTLILGMKQNTLVVAALMTAALAFVLNMFIGGLGLIFVSGLFFKYAALPLTEWILDKVPRKYLVHTFDWVTSMDGLHITNDSNPIPVEMPATRAAARAQKGRDHSGATAADPNAF